MDTTNMIFVFGSNLRGVHGAGAARFAYLHKGAMHGVGVGIRGKSYALPTKDVRINTLSLYDIEGFVDMFIEYAKCWPGVQFQVTRVGCGLAGYKDKDIAPMFVHAPANCFFDSAWEPWFGETKQYWGTM